MTLQTVWKFFMKCGTMRQPVAILAFWYLPVPFMTFCTMQLRMLGMVFLQIFINGGVTRTTHLVVHIFRIFQDVFSAVGTMAYKAVSIRLPGNMRLMTIQTGWFDTVFVGMTACTAHLFVVLTGMSFHFPSFRFVMAHLAGDHGFSALYPDLFGHSGKGDILWRMRVFVALEALGKCLAVRSTMAPGAFRHYLRIIVFGRNIGMKLGVTIQTVESVPAVAFL